MSTSKAATDDKKAIMPKAKRNPLPSMRPAGMTAKSFGRVEKIRVGPVAISILKTRTDGTINSDAMTAAPTSPHATAMADLVKSCSSFK